MLSTKSNNPNYLARVCVLESPRKHNNADKLLCWSVLSNNIITDLSYKEGDLVVYFPLESSLNKDFLSWGNMFQDKDLNNDKNKKGYFPSAARCKAVKLRGERSEGVIFKVSLIEEWLRFINSSYVFVENDVNKDFDNINDIELCCKYLNQEAVRQARNLENYSKNKDKKVKRVSKIIDGQFRLVEDTKQLKREIHNLNPESTITIGYKIHGSATSIGNVLCKRKLNWFEKILKKVGVNINDIHYDLVVASRRVIKNAYSDYESASYYSEDIWTKIGEKYKESIKAGITLQGEIAGQLSTGAWIQRDFDYGLPPKSSDLWVWRIFYTSSDGDIYEFSTPQVIKYCEKHNLKYVPILYYGKAKDLFPELDIENHWHENFLNKLIEKYTEKDCFMCSNKVPEEGVVIHAESGYFEPYKLKSFRFFERESLELDQCEANIEDIN